MIVTCSVDVPRSSSEGRAPLLGTEQTGQTLHDLQHMSHDLSGRKLQNMAIGARTGQNIATSGQKEIGKLPINTKESSIQGE